MILKRNILMPSPDVLIPTLLKWKWGKRKHIKTAIEVIPNSGLEDCKEFIDPFVGGGSLLLAFLLHIIPASKFPKESKITACDINPHVISFHTCVKNSPEELIRNFSEIVQEFESLETHEEKKKKFYERRKEYNSIVKTAERDSPKASALFLFINRTCYMGIMRENKKGDINSPFGIDKNNTGSINVKTMRKNLLQASQAYTRVDFKCESCFDENGSLARAGEKSLVLIDPPPTSDKDVGKFDSERLKGLLNESKFFSVLFLEKRGFNLDPDIFYEVDAKGKLVIQISRKGNFEKIFKPKEKKRCGRPRKAAVTLIKHSPISPKTPKFNGICPSKIELPPSPIQESNIEEDLALPDIIF